MAQPIVTGARATAGSQGISQNVRVIDMSDTIHLLDPNLAPLTSVTMKLRKSRCISPKFEWLEDDYLPATDAIDGAIADGVDTTWDVDNSDRFRVNDLVLVPETGEVVHVTAVSSSTPHLTVTRSVGATAGAAISDNAVLIIIGNANAEGSTSRTVKTTQKTPHHNFTQISRWPFASTGTTQASELYGGDDLTLQSKKAGMEHKIQIERTFLFGEKGEDTSGATALRFTGGILERITTNVSAVAATTLANMETFLRDGFRYGPSDKMLFASRHWVSYISEAASTKLQTRVMDSKFPLSITEYISPHGTVYIVTHNLLDQDIGATKKYQGYALLLDLDCIWYRYLQGRDTRLRTNIQANDEDSRKDEYISECGVQLVQEKNHAIAHSAASAS